MQRKQLLLESLVLASMLDFERLPHAVANSQTLRRGVTPGTIDLIIATHRTKPPQNC